MRKKKSYERFQESLMEAMAGGDREVISAEVMRFTRAVIKSLVRQAPAGLDFEDAAQHAAIIAMRGISKWDPDSPRSIPVDTWLYRVILLDFRSSCRDQVRYSRRMRSLAEVA